MENKIDTNPIVNQFIYVTPILIVFLLGIWMLQLGVSPVEEFAQAELEDHPNASLTRITSGQRTFLSAYMLHVIVILGILAGCYFEFRKFGFCLATRATYFAVILAAATVTVGHFSGLVQREAYPLISQKHFFGLFRIGEEVSDKVISQKHFQLMLVLSDVITIIVALVLIAAFLTTTASPKQKFDRDFQISIFRLQALRLGRYLYFASALLVSGTILTASWIQWPAPLIHENDEYHRLANSLSLFYGLFYSLMLAALYIPAWAFIRHKWTNFIETVPESYATGGQPVPGTTLPGLEFGLFSKQQFTTILAVLAPFLAGAVGSLLEALGKTLAGT